MEHDEFIIIRGDVLHQLVVDTMHDLECARCTFDRLNISGNFVDIRYSMMRLDEVIKTLHSYYDNPRDYCEKNK